MTLEEQRELTDWLAVNVLKWKKGETFWENESGRPAGYLILGVDVLEIISSGFDSFNPTVNYNHLAVMRQKMRDEGWKRLSQDELIGTFSVTYIFPNPWKSFASLGQTDERIAECLAIRAAKEAEK